MKRLFIVVAVIMTMALFLGQSAQAEEVIKWKMSTTWTPDIQLIEADKHYAGIVNTLAKGRLEIKFFDGGSLVPPFELFDAVAKGTLQAGGDWPNYWSGKDSAFDLLGSYPYGLTPIDYMVWIWQGGGFELYQEVYGKFGLVYLPTGVTPMESGVRGHKPINSLADFKGLKIRMSGKTQGKILQELGAAQVMMAGGEIYQALEKGVIDAGEFCSPSIDWGMGFQEVTEYWATPGWHQPASLLGVMINKEAWDKLGPELQEILKIAAQANFTWSFTFFEYSSIDGTAKFKEKAKITRLGEEDLKQAQEITNRLTIESAKENPLFAKVAYSQFKFLADVADWREIASPFTYGRNPTLPNLDEIKAQVK